MSSSEDRVECKMTGCAKDITEAVLPVRPQAYLRQRWERFIFSFLAEEGSYPELGKVYIRQRIFLHYFHNIVLIASLVCTQRNTVENKGLKAHICLWKCDMVT
jgi:hypothetical protein